MATVAFIGLGVMGAPMAGHLASAGHDVRVYNRSASKADRWAGEHRGTRGREPGRRCRRCRRRVHLRRQRRRRTSRRARRRRCARRARGRRHHRRPHHRVGNARARTVDDRRASGVGFVDAPVSGGQAGAVNGTLTIMCGGDPDGVRQVAPLMAAYSRACTLLGPSGSGQLTKMVNQIAIAGLLQGLAEALDFGMRAGLDIDTVIDVIGKGAARVVATRQQRTHDGARRIRFRLRRAVDAQGPRHLHRRGRNATAPRWPITKVIDGYYAEIVEMGGARWDTSSLIRRLGHRRSTELAGDSNALAMSWAICAGFSCGPRCPRPAAVCSSAVWQVAIPPAVPSPRGNESAASP